MADIIVEGGLMARDLFLAQSAWVEISLFDKEDAALAVDYKWKTWYEGMEKKHKANRRHCLKCFDFDCKRHEATRILR